MLETSCGVFRNISASNVVRHPKYVGGAYYDVAVVHVEKRFPFNKFIKPICLPEQNDSNLDRHKGQLMRLAGTISQVLSLQNSCTLIVASLTGWGSQKLNGTTSPELMMDNIKVKHHAYVCIDVLYAL